MRRTVRRRPAALRVGVVLAVLLAACGGGTEPATTTPGSAPVTDPPPVTLTFVVYDSFPTEGTSLNDALDDFTASTGVRVKVVSAGDAGTMVTKAVLTSGNPEGDVMWGVDNTLLSRAVEAGVFEPYRAAGRDAIPAEFTSLSPEADVTPVDFGDVCVNYDIAWFAERGLEPPAGLDDLTDPAYRDLLVVQDPSTSSPGLAFLLATVARYGAPGWEDYWRALRANGVRVASSWTTAYYEMFSGSGGGDRPLVVSYGSSPPAEVVFADPPRDEPPTAVIASTCFRQVEFAGVLRGTRHPAEARQLVDFLVSPQFQAELPLNLFVYPVVPGVRLPDVFTRFAVVPERPLTVDPGAIAVFRESWQDRWTEIVLR